MRRRGNLRARRRITAILTRESSRQHGKANWPRRWSRLIALVPVREHRRRRLLLPCSEGRHIPLEPPVLAMLNARFDGPGKTIHSGSGGRRPATSDPAHPALWAACMIAASLLLPDSSAAAGAPPKPPPPAALPARPHQPARP